MEGHATREQRRGTGIGVKGVTANDWPRVGDEGERLDALRVLDVLDPPAEGRLDRVTRLAARLLGAPMAMVSLRDAERHRVISRSGMEYDDARMMRPLCARVADDHVLAVSDTARDERFRDLDAVVGHPGVRACAGRPLTISGRRIGALCVFDVYPREFRPDQLASLDDLAGWAETELRLEDSRRVAYDLANLQRRTGMLLSSTAEGVIDVDEYGRIVFANTAAERITDWSARQLVGRDMHWTLHVRGTDGTPCARADCAVGQTLRSGRTQSSLHGTFWRRDGRPVPVDWSCGAVLEDERVVGAVVVFADATRRLEVERLKDDFVSTVSHELRTPLTSVLGALDLLASGLLSDVPPDAQRMIDIAHGNARRLGLLVDDILDVERSNRGRLDLNRQPVDLTGLMEAAAATVAGAAEAARVALIVEPFPVPDGHVWGDEHRLVQALTNLLGNAVRHSRAGGRVWLHGEADQEAVRLSVTDEGEGIADEVVDRVFDQFWQADASDRRLGGTGLGLTIAKNIVEAHDGFVLADSLLGQGSTFTVALPLRR